MMYTYINIITDGKLDNIKKLYNGIKNIPNIVLDIELNNININDLYYILKVFKSNNIKITLSVTNIQQLKLINNLNMKEYNIVNVSILLDYNFNDIIKLNNLLNNSIYKEYLYIDIFFEKNDIYEGSNKIIKLYKNLNKLDIKLGITIKDLSNNEQSVFKYLKNNLANLTNYIDHQLNIFNTSNVCTPNAFIFLLSTGLLYVACGIEKTEIKIINLNKYLNKKYSCDIDICPIGDAINKEYNYNTFYKGT